MSHFEFKKNNNSKILGNVMEDIKMLMLEMF